MKIRKTTMYVRTWYQVPGTRSSMYDPQDNSINTNINSTKSRIQNTTRKIWRTAVLGTPFRLRDHIPWESHDTIYMGPGHRRTPPGRESTTAGFNGMFYTGSSHDGIRRDTLCGIWTSGHRGTPRDGIQTRRPAANNREEITSKYLERSLSRIFNIL